MSDNTHCLSNSIGFISLRAILNAFVFMIEISRLTENTLVVIITEQTVVFFTISTVYLQVWILRLRWTFRITNSFEYPEACLTGQTELLLFTSQAIL